MKRFIEREDELAPSYNVSFVDYEADDKYHEEFFERLDLLTERPPENCEISEKLNTIEKNNLMKIIDNHRAVLSKKKFLPGRAKIEGRKIYVTTNTPM